MGTWLFEESWGHLLLLSSHQGLQLQVQAQSRCPTPPGTELYPRPPCAEVSGCTEEALPPHLRVQTGSEKKGHSGKGASGQQRLPRSRPGSEPGGPTKADKRPAPRSR